MRQVNDKKSDVLYSALICYVMLEVAPENKTNSE